MYVTGVGAVSAFGDSIDVFRDRLLSGATGIAPCPKLAAFGCRSTLAARVAAFDAARWIPPMKLRRMDITGAFALAAIQQAMQEAGYTPADTGDDRAGVVLGTYSAGGQSTNEYLEALFRGGPTGAPALMFNSTVSNAAAGLAGLEFRLRGPNATITQKEASGLAALATAVDLLRADRADAIATGGTDAVYDIFFRAHDRFGVLNSAAGPGPETAPFDRRRQGFVLGEGGFALWLERGTTWRGRRSGPLGVIRGIGASGAAVPLNSWPDRPDPLVRTMELALNEAGVRPREVAVVFASANASAVLDDVEARAIATLFGDGPLVTSVKGALGECGASGSASCVAAIACAQKGAVPPVAGLDAAAPSAQPIRLVRTATPLSLPAIALVNSVASGGALYSVVLALGA